MQIIFLSPWQNIAACFLAWAMIQITVAFLVGIMPDKLFDRNNLLFCSKNFEKGGRIYEKYFAIKRWKRYLPDGSAITGVGLKKKRLRDTSDAGLRYFLSESCKAELIHLLSIPPFLLFGFFCPLEVIPIMLLYALAVNLPCLITQRYNRPRIERILKLRNAI